MEAKKLPSIEPYSKRWEQLADQVARDYAPEMYPCGKCGYPVARNYCCTFCGDSNPEDTAEEEAAWEAKYSQK